MANYTRRKINIVIMGESFVSWAGGVAFLRLIIHSLLSVKHLYDFELYCFVPDNCHMDRLKRILRPIKRFVSQLFRSKMSIAKIDGFKFSAHDDIPIGSSKVCFYNRNNLNKLLEMVNADILLPCMFPSHAEIGLPWIGYIFDFQHKYFPEYFSKRQREYRDLLFKNMLDKASSVFVNAKAVENDINMFYPDSLSQIYSLPFTPYIHDYSEIDTSVAHRYNLPKKYFLISNQFNKHKSHITAFKALHDIITKYDREIHIVCTGDTYDTRNPAYYNEIMNFITRNALNRYIHILGYIAKEDQLSIMRRSVAVVQPTLFEGGPGGGAVYDAVAYGIPSVVSDIAVNCEINSELVDFFRAGSADDLTLKMTELMNRPRKEIDIEVLLKRSHDSLQSLGIIIYNAVDNELQK